MSRTEYKDDCKGCRPAMIDAQTGKRVPDDSPIMKTINAVWDKASVEEREGFHRVTCMNSREVVDLNLAEQIINRIQLALAN